MPIWSVAPVPTVRTKDLSPRTGFRVAVSGGAKTSSLLRHLLEEGEDVAHFVELYEENEEYKFSPEKFENQREVYGLEPDELFDFEYELASLLDDWKTDRSAVDMAEEVETIRAYLLERKNWKGH